MSNLDEIRQARLNKLAILKEKGIDPYPAVSNASHTLAQLVAGFAVLESEKTVVTAVGRVMSFRSQGSLIFFDLFDGTGRFQSLLKKDTAEEAFLLFDQTVDIGDFVEVSGNLFVTKRGQQTIEVSSWNMLSKSLSPLPEKWAGLQDVEEKMRKRYLDILFNDDVREMIVKKAKFWQSIRNFLVQEGFLEVETPVIENTTGGADARPFATHHNALDIDVYLRISAGELWQKKLMVAGFPKVFEIGRIFRNEGMSPEHLQDYTQMEFYWAYADYKKGMELVERMYKHVAMETFGTLEFKIGNFDVNLGNKWEIFDYTETILKITGVDISTADLKEVEGALKKFDIK